MTALTKWGYYAFLIRDCGW
ncbi:hypothetical protein TcasGA2_TC004182 [Tribolium castaneum]|uniref:Uncharacterized protein n=1 Tax=Tribolium castaneum TaxID=7070 RepID=D7GYF9_TRICA|nr:hypothetical protein TcasGA2_TC004182 [Tribolium castaneum]